MQRSQSSRREEQLSRYLSKILRHQGPAMGFRIGSDGYVCIDELLSHPSFKSQHYTHDDIEAVVKHNDKQRFNLIQRKRRWFIRANQGHSFPVPNLELTSITDASKYPTVLHGTSFQPLSTILKDGLSRMDRTHIHFTTGEYGSKGVISGMRRSAEVLIHIDLEKALQDSLEFYVSANSVILSPGNEQGYILPKYFRKVVNANTGQLIS